VRLITLLGPPGVGKTRLAIELGMQLVQATEVQATEVTAWADGVWLVEFAPLADAALVPQLILQVFGLADAARVPGPCADLGRAAVVPHDRRACGVLQ
jgi:predicted ATPase